MILNPIKLTMKINVHTWVASRIADKAKCGQWQTLPMFLTQCNHDLEPLDKTTQSGGGVTKVSHAWLWESYWDKPIEILNRLAPSLWWLSKARWSMNCLCSNTHTYIKTPRHTHSTHAQTHTQRHMCVCISCVAYNKFKQDVSQTLKARRRNSSLKPKLSL